MEPTSQVSMYITQITRLEKGDNQGEGTISCHRNTTTKIQKFACNHLVMFTCLSHKSPPWKTGTTKGEDFKLRWDTNTKKQN